MYQQGRASGCPVNGKSQMYRGKNNADSASAHRNMEDAFHLLVFKPHAEHKTSSRELLVSHQAFPSCISDPQGSVKYSLRHADLVQLLPESSFSEIPVTSSESCRCTLHAIASLCVGNRAARCSNTRGTKQIRNRWYSEEWLDLTRTKVHDASWNISSLFRGWT